MGRVVARETMLRAVDHARARGASVVLANGAFDLIHCNACCNARIAGITCRSFLGRGPQRGNNLVGARVDLLGCFTGKDRSRCIG